MIFLHFIIGNSIFAVHNNIYFTLGFFMFQATNLLIYTGRGGVKCLISKGVLS